MSSEGTKIIFVKHFNILDIKWSYKALITYISQEVSDPLELGDREYEVIIIFSENTELEAFEYELINKGNATKITKDVYVYNEFSKKFTITLKHIKIQIKDCDKLIAETSTPLLFIYYEKTYIVDVVDNKMFKFIDVEYNFCGWYKTIKERIC